jgi:hypothetical protein
MTDVAGLTAMLLDKRPGAMVIRPLLGQGSSLSIDGVDYGSEPILVSGEKRMRVADLELLLQGGEWLFQQRVEQHSFLQDINPYGLNTIRIVTFVNVDDSAELHLAILRLGMKRTSLANRDGEIVVAVDLETGKLGKGIYRNSHEGQVTSIHPNSLAVFTGQVLPQWHKIVGVCKAAALAMPQMRAVGWDLALSPGGPVLLEGNRDWDIGMMQVHTKGYLQPQVLAKLNLCGLDFDPCLKWAFFREMIKQRV